MSSRGQIVGLGRRALSGLRHVLEREYGDSATAALQEAGFVAGDEVFDVFAEWLAKEAGVQDPGDLDAQYLAQILTDFFTSLGWGTVNIEQLGSAGLAIDSSDWAEADPEEPSPMPACHITAGMLAGFLGRLAGLEVAVMELECRTRGDSRCRFLAGSAETLQAVYDGVNSGRDYREVLGADEAR